MQSIFPGAHGKYTDQRGTRNNSKSVRSDRKRRGRSQAVRHASPVERRAQETAIPGMNARGCTLCREPRTNQEGGREASLNSINQRKENQAKRN